jgi:hypothetical protein
LGASQIEHFAVALAGFFNMQLSQVQSPPEDPGCFMPAALQSKPPFEDDAGGATDLVRSKVGREAVDIALASSRALDSPSTEGAGKVNVKAGKDARG